jgi:hypothetical protein
LVELSLQQNFSVLDKWRSTQFKCASLVLMAR